VGLGQVPQVLRITARHLDDLVFDRQELASTLLEPLRAMVARRDGELIARSSLVESTVRKRRTLAQNETTPRGRALATTRDERLAVWPIDR
jgi:hypothetical protein